MSYNCLSMGRKRKKHKNFPKHLFLKQGRYYYVRFINGRIRWYPLKTQDEAEALKRWAEVEAAVNKDFAFNIEKLKENAKATISFPELIDRFLSGEKPENEDVDEGSGESPAFSKSTERNYKRMAESLKELFTEPVHRIKRQDIMRYRDSLRKTPYEANRRVALMRVVMQKAVDWGYIEINPCDRIKKFKEKKHKLRLTEDILFKNIYPVADPMLKRAIMFAFHLVQHEHEIKGLEWKNFDSEKHCVSFTRHKTDEDIVINYSQNATLIAFIEHLKATRRELSPYIICRQSRRGWLPYQHFRSMWARALEDAGYQPGDFKFKELRHLANTLLKDANISADKRRAMTGHKTVQANEVYTHPTGADTIESGLALSRYCPPKF